MGGTPVKDIPITRNRHGKRMINVDVMKSLGIMPKPVFLIDTEFVSLSKGK
jgi:hypothetical protein